MTIPAIIRTPRLALVPATPDLAQAELNDPKAFSDLLGAVVPDDWPPRELFDARILFLCLLETNPSWIGWLGWYAVELGTDGDGPGDPDRAPRPEIEASSGDPAFRPPTLTGSVGFKGPPDEAGAVEIGYSILPAHESRGLATEMTAALVEWAAGQGALLVQAQVQPANPASTRVLEKLGFREIAIDDPTGTRLFARETGPAS